MLESGKESQTWFFVFSCWGLNLLAKGCGFTGRGCDSKRCDSKRHGGRGYDSGGYDSKGDDSKTSPSYGLLKKNPLVRRQHPRHSSCRQMGLIYLVVSVN